MSSHYSNGREQYPLNNHGREQLVIVGGDIQSC